MRISFFIAITPRGQARARHTRQGITYTPAAQRIQNDMLTALLMPHAPSVPFCKPVKLTLNVMVGVPASKSKKWKERANKGLEHPGKPDLDNYVKSVLDRLNGVFFLDDRQVVEIHAQKLYSDIPGYQITLEEIE